MNPVIENLLTRRSVRSFQKKQIPLEDLELILKAGSYAPNGMGLQVWKFTAIQNPQVLKKVDDVIRQVILSTPLENADERTLRMIERAKDPNHNFLNNAPTYIIVSHLKDSLLAMADSALALGNMMLAAHSLGIGSCWFNSLPRMTHHPFVRQLLTELEIPEDHIVYAAGVFGYPEGDIKPSAPRKEGIIKIF